MITFVKAGSEEGDAISRILLKETEKRKYKPKQIVDLMNQEGYPKFKQHHHAELWQALKAKDAKIGYGVYLKEGDWWWYENWLERVRAHCQENKERYV